MKISFIASLVMAMSLCIATSCSEEEVSPVLNNPRVLISGETIPINNTIRINSTGYYTLETGGALLTTRCNGSVAVTIEYAPDEIHVNSCQNTTGGSSQTNVVTGITQVLFELETGSYADVSLQ